MSKATQVLGIILLGAMTIFTAVGAFKTQKVENIIEKENEVTYGFNEYCYINASINRCEHCLGFGSMSYFVNNNKIVEINETLLSYTSGQYLHIHYMVKYIK